MRELPFLIFFTAIIILIALFSGNSQLAMWLGFGLATYSAIGNDSIQTLGTFLSSNEKVRWWILWLFIGGIFVATMSYGWVTGNGDVSFERLTKIPPTDTFTFFHLFAPAVLLLLTRYKVPVSTTFLILSVFSSTDTIEKMLTKTLYGYILAFIAALVFWGILGKVLRKYFKRSLSSKEQRVWRVFQWVSTSFLWMSWLMQDTANIAVFLPRQLSFEQLVLFLTAGFGLIGILFFFRGGAIQAIVREKKDVMEVRAATMIDFLFAFILVYFKQINNVPMSTTWVFLGMLAGREIILSHYAGWKNPFKETAYLVAKDILLATIGLIVSILLVVFTRPTEMLAWLKDVFL